MLCFFASKGGVGCSVAAAGAALLSSRDDDTLLVDLAGDQSELLGLPEDGPGLGGWLAAPAALPDTLVRLESEVSDRLSLLPFGSTARLGQDSHPIDRDRLSMLGSFLAADGRRVIVDIGRATNNPSAVVLLGVADRTVLVVRPCYLALRAAADVPAPDEVVLIDEPGRALRPKDVEAALDAGPPLVVAHDLAVARRVDAGLLASRPPRSLLPLARLL